MHPEIQSVGSLITSAAAQLISLARPAQITLLEISLQVSLNFFGAIVDYYIITDDGGTTKHHVSSALRTAIVTHVAEILRDAGPKVMFCKFITLKSHNIAFA